MEEGSHGFSGIQGAAIRFVKFGGNKMAKRKKRIATVNRKLGISISCRVHKSVLKDLDAYRESTKTFALRRLGKARLGPPGPTERACLHPDPSGLRVQIGTLS